MNEHGHLTEDVLLDAIYGIASDGPQAHADACPECAGRLRELRRRASAGVDRLNAAGAISDEFLAAQRRKIYQRIDRPSRKLWWWAPGLAMASALVVGVLVYQPHRVYQPQRSPTPASHSEISDAQLFSDVYSMERTPEPSATAPVHALFEEQAQ
jgi:hypothetical protein